MALYNIMIMEKPGWGNKLADEPLTYGQQLMTIAAEIDSENNTVTGKLTRLDNITLFKKSASTKYYSLDHYYIDKTPIGHKINITTDIENKDLDLCIYVTLPIFTNRTDTA